AALGAGAAAAGPAPARAARSGVWPPSFGSRDAPDRIACAAFTGPEAGPGVYISFATPGAPAPGALSAFVFRESALRGEDTTIGGDGFGERSGVAFVFSNGAVFLAKDMVRGDDEGVTAEAYPDPAFADDIIAAMAASAEMKLMRGDAALHAMALDGFADAFAAVAEACGYKLRAAG
ncbi:MAG: hypothetical protein AAGF90_10190, partial [Pseudomonadota bacterium]